mgnify:FL=1
MEEQEVPLDKLAKVYRNIRAKIQQLTQEHEAAIASLEEAKNTVVNELKDRMLKGGVKTMRTDYGTIMLGTKTRYFTTDWDSFKKFVMEHEALDLFEKRIAQLNMAQFLEENPGVVPPGLNSDKIGRAHV